MNRRTKLVVAIVLAVLMVLPLMPIGEQTYTVSVKIIGYASSLPTTTNRPGYGGISSVTLASFRVTNIGDFAYSLIFPWSSSLTNRTEYVPPQELSAHNASFEFVAAFRSNKSTQYFDSPILYLDNLDECEVNATIATSRIPAGTYSVEISLLIDGSPYYLLGNNYTLTLP